MPDQDVEANRVMEAPAYLQKVIQARGPIRIRTQKERPEDPFAAVRYRNQWFYLDAADHISKRSFAAMLMFFELLAPTGGGAVPLLSLPTG